MDFNLSSDLNCEYPRILDFSEGQVFLHFATLQLHFHSAKTRKEAKHMALMDGIASAKTRVEDLKSSIQEKRTKNSEYAKFLSQHSLGSYLFVNLHTT